MIKEPIYKGILQSDLDFAGFNPINLTGWPPTGGGGGGGMPGVFKNVKDAPYNATGNGTTDDTVAIQTAINDVWNAGGGVVFIPQGVYLCNGAFDATTNSVLKIPYVTWTSGAQRTIEIRGEVDNIYSPAGQPLYASVLKCTKAGTGTQPSFLSGAAPAGWTTAPGSLNATLVCIRNLQFTLPNTTRTMWGVHLGSVGWAVVENCSILCGATGAGPGTIGLWMPNTSNLGINHMNRVTIGFFDIGMATGELLRCRHIYVTSCGIGIQFNPGFYMSEVTAILDRCPRGIYFPQDIHPVDIRASIEHTTAVPLTYDIDDPNSYGRGHIWHVVGSAETGHVEDGLVVNGAANLRIHNTYAPYLDKQYIGSKARLVPTSTGVNLEYFNGTAWVVAQGWP